MLKHGKYLLTIPLILACIIFSACSVYDNSNAATTTPQTSTMPTVTTYITVTPASTVTTTVSTTITTTASPITISTPSTTTSTTLSPVIHQAYYDKGCTLFSPQERLLLAGSDQLFRLSAPNSTSVWVIMDNQPFYLRNEGNFLYSTTLHISQGSILVFATFSYQPDSLILLEYEGVNSLPTNTSAVSTAVGTTSVP